MKNSANMLLTQRCWRVLFRLNNFRSVYVISVVNFTHLQRLMTSLIFPPLLLLLWNHRLRFLQVIVLQRTRERRNDLDCLFFVVLFQLRLSLMQFHPLVDHDARYSLLETHDLGLRLCDIRHSFVKFFTEPLDARDGYSLGPLAMVNS